MSEPTLEQLAQRAAQSAARRPDYLAAVLAVYQRQEGLDDAALANRLELPVAELPWLRLCRRPRSDHFAADIEAITARFKLNALALARAVRQVDALAKLAQVPVDAEVGWLAAAREHDVPYDPEAEPSQESDDTDPEAPATPEPERD